MFILISDSIQVTVSVAETKELLLSSKLTAPLDLDDKDLTGQDYIDCYGGNIEEVDNEPTNQVVATANAKVTTTTTSIIGQVSVNLRQLIIDAVAIQRGIDAKSGSVSDTLLTIAKSYQVTETIGIENETNSDKFLNACSTDEQYIKSSDAGESQVDKLPRCYTQAKSNIKAAINYGLDLTEYTSESALRKDVAKVRQGKGQSAFNAAVSSFKKDIESLPEKQALELLKQFSALTKQALLQLVPVEPKKVTTTTLTPEQQAQSDSEDAEIQAMIDSEEEDDLIEEVVSGIMGNATSH